MATVFCDCGTAWLTQLMNATITVTTFFIGWGSGAGTAAKADTTLFTEAGSRQLAANSITAFNTRQWVATNTCGPSGPNSVTNAGLYHNNSGTLLIKGDFSTIALQNADRIEFTITLTST